MLWRTGFNVAGFARWQWNLPASTGYPYIKSWKSEDWMYAS